MTPGPHALGWLVLPRPDAPRWWLPRGRATRASLAVYHPVTARARAGWRLARGLALLGAHRLLGLDGEPMQTLQHLVAPDMPAGGSIAVMRANHADRFVALLLDGDGRPVRVAKIALSETGRRVLDREVAALTDLATKLPAPVTAPRVVAYRPGILVMPAVTWRVRRRPWFLPAGVAASLGTLYRSTRTRTGPQLGAAHGDCAPWNLLWTGSGWTLVDWEAADDLAPPFTDLFHFVVQAHALLKRPRRDTVLRGLDGHGWIGRAIRAYSESAELAPDAAIGCFRAYLTASMDKLDLATHSGRVGWTARKKLLDARHGMAG